MVKGAPGGSRQPGTPRARPRPLATQPLPRVLEPAASKAADFTAFDHVGAASWVPRAAASTISADRDSVFYWCYRAPCPH
eukprot:scaffold123835_cov57-Phaeocystis_antarctica.AAC.1